MSLGREFESKVPENTAKLAKKLYKKNKNIYITMGDTIPDLFANEDFRDLYSKLGQHAVNPVVMMLITMVQFIENLSDREVMTAIIGRIDLKYLLRLPLEHQGFNASDLAKFRTRLIEGGLDRKIFERVLELASEKGMVKQGKQRTDSTHIIAAVGSLTRTELIIEAMRKALDFLAKEAPDFTKEVVKDLLVLNAYTQRGMNFRIPKKDNESKALAESVAKDSKFLLEEIQRDASHLLQSKPIVILRRILGEQFDFDQRGQPRQKDQKELAKSRYLLGSPYDTDARYSTKRSETWLGYKLQITETCGAKSVSIITDVRITRSTVSDSEQLHNIQRTLAKKGLAPKEHLVDSGYTSMENIRKSDKDYEIEVIGPVQTGNSWQKVANKGFDSSNFEVDWKERSVTCPAGKRSQKWIDRKDRSAIYVLFSAETCGPCPFKLDCTTAKTNGRAMEFKAKELIEFHEAHKKKLKSPSYWQKYQLRSGIEGTISRITNRFGMRRSRYIGIRKAEMQANFAAASLNLVRITASSMGHPGSVTRVSPLNRLLLAG